ncbi:hypothetical protein BC827DRAFT_1222005 [Russula dissimulans]|nr:hypothetical protein BC827DRAFT_1222005 [Russula dissimulans]
MSSHQRIQIHHLFPQLISRIAQPSPDNRDSSSPIRGHSEGSKSVKGFSRRWKELIKRRGRRTRHSTTTIGALPDGVLLNIFDFYRLDFLNYVGPTYTWHRLVHVCKRWRHIVFASVRRLDVRIACTERTPVRKSLRLDVWPPLPIIIKCRLCSTTSNFPTSSVMTALDHRDRVCQIQLSHLSPALLEILATSIQEPFPALTILELCSDDDTAPILPGSFLAGFAPRLQRLLLEGIAFPALPRLLLSAIGLVSLLLDKIPPNTYISPKVITTCLSTLTRLKFLRIEFQSPSRTFDGSQRPQTQTRAVLPSLTWLEFKGANEYMEDLMARIETPLLNHAQIKFLNQTIFDITQLSQFIDRAERLNDPSQAKVDFLSDFAEITVSQPRGRVGNLTLQISSTTPDWQVSSMAQICHRASPLLSGVERLEICGGEYGYLQDEWQGDIENTHWLGLLYPFIAVERLHITEYLGSLVASALGGIPARRAAEVLPELRSLFLEELEPSEFVQSAIRQFVSARRHPVAICHRKCEWEDELRWLDLETDD